MSIRAIGRPAHLAPGDNTGGCVRIEAIYVSLIMTSVIPRNPRCVHRGLNGPVGKRCRLNVAVRFRYTATLPAGVSAMLLSKISIRFVSEKIPARLALSVGPDVWPVDDP